MNKAVGPYPTNSFSPVNIVCLLRLLHIFKCTPEYCTDHTAPG